MRTWLITLILFFALVQVAIAADEDWAWCGDQDIFFRNDSSDIPGYFVMDHRPQIEDTQYKYVAVSAATGPKTIASWMTPAGSPGVTVIAPGLWRFRTYLNVSSAVGTTVYEFKVFNRSADGTETDLYYGKVITNDVNALTPTESLNSYARRNYTYLYPGDRLVIKINASTSSVTERNAWIGLAGNTRASTVGVGYFMCDELSGVSKERSDTGGEAVGVAAGVIGGLIGSVLIINRIREREE